LSTQQANEAASTRLSPSAVRTPLPRPHLVATSDKRPHAEGAGDSEIALGSHPASLQGLDPSTWVSSARRFAALATSRTSLNAAVKRVMDILGACVLAVVFAPLMLGIVVLMRREGDSVIFRHRRVGRDGRMFECLKFRTMVPNADQVLRNLLEANPEIKAEWVRDHKLKNDPRITRLGRFLRRTSLDELPQLWNVVKGEMSLVGPRPVVREELLRYGITGLWQVTGRNDTDYRRRVVLDSYYVRNQNVLLDLFILVKTVGVVLGGSGAY
jgi:exopolysaccharide production protein ExoY